jgi:hypothetical protein
MLKKCIRCAITVLSPLHRCANKSQLIGNRIAIALQTKRNRDTNLFLIALQMLCLHVMFVSQLKYHSFAIASLSRCDHLALILRSLRCRHCGLRGNIFNTLRLPHIRFNRFAIAFLSLCYRIFVALRSHFCRFAIALWSHYNRSQTTPSHTKQTHHASHIPNLKGSERSAGNASADATPASGILQLQQWRCRCG